MAFRSLDAVTSTGTSDTLIFRQVPETWTVQTTTTGTPTTVTIDVEGSMDGETFHQVAQHTVSGTGDLFHVVNTPLRYIRLNLTTLTGGTSPTVTAILEANEHK